MLRYGTAAFITFAFWDWITTAGTRYIASGSDWAVPVAAITTGLWFYGTKLLVDKPQVIPLLMVGAAFGTWLGLRWP